MRQLAVLFAVALACASALPGINLGPHSDKIEHVVVLMLENRAYDHMLGRLNQWLGPNATDGLTGNEFNVYNGTKYFVADKCPYINPFDPLHDYTDVTIEVMGSAQWVSPAPMSGFCKAHAQKGVPDYWMVMHGFAPSAVPAISTLAENFAVFDKWYSSLPGPTYPNRMFWHSATSHGMTSNSILDYIPGMPQETIFDVLNTHELPWSVYYGDVSDTILFSKLRSLDNLEKLHSYSEFANATAAGMLGAYTWVAPNFFPWGDTGASDQHPDHDVVLGEKLIAEVYAAVRASPLWNKTALIVTYDEHGGLYDHVSPPAKNIPNPDGMIAKDGFNFTRLGVRVPMVVASPWVPKGTVVGEPAAGGHFEHASMYATMRNLFGLPEQLTNRSAVAATFDFVFSLAAPRTDCPTSLPTPTDSPARQAAIVADQKRRAPNGLQRELFATLEMALGLEVTEGAGIATQEEMAGRVRELMAKLLRKPLS